jgi:C4-dicarboxylate-binding protein DctP
VRLQAILIGLLALVFSSTAVAQQPIVIKFSHVVSPDSPKGQAAEKFAELAAQYTNGRVKVEVYPSSRLYQDVEEFPALQSGWVQMLAPSLSKLSALGVREFEVFDLPYLFPDRAAVLRVMDGPIGLQLLKKLESKGIVGLAYWDNGFKQMSANRPLVSALAQGGSGSGNHGSKEISTYRPAVTAQDFKGLKMRVQPGSKVLVAEMRALGATPMPIPFSEVYADLKQGAVDGTENPMSNFYTQRFFRVQKYLTISDHGYLGYAVIANKKFWDGLPADVRSALEQAMQETTAYEREIALTDNESALAAVREAGTTEVYVLTPEERTAWQEALRPVHREFESRIGGDLLRSVYEAVAAGK